MLFIDSMTKTNKSRAWLLARTLIHAEHILKYRQSVSFHVSYSFSPSPRTRILSTIIFSILCKKCFSPLFLASLTLPSYCVHLCHEEKSVNDLSACKINWFFFAWFWFLAGTLKLITIFWVKTNVYSTARLEWSFKF